MKKSQSQAEGNVRRGCRLAKAGVGVCRWKWKRIRRIKKGKWISYKKKIIDATQFV